MLRKSLVPSALLLSIAVLSAMTSAAQAQVSVPMSGTVAKACAFGAPTAGILTGNLSVPTQLSSSNAAGAAGKVSVTCNSAATVSGAAPTVTTGLTATYTLTAGAVTGTTVQAPVGTTPLLVNLKIDNGATPLPPSATAYSYNVVVTAVPN
jgi:hypothetical protein